MYQIMYVGVITGNRLDSCESLPVLFLAPPVEDLVKHYIDIIMTKSGAIALHNDLTHALQIEMIERLLDFHIYNNNNKPLPYKGFALPSFFELAEHIYYRDKALITEPNMTSALVFLTRNIVRDLSALKPLVILISDTTLHKLVEPGGNLLYGYKDMFIIESYSYITEDCDSTAILYVKNVGRVNRIIEKILLECPNLILSVDLTEMAIHGIPISILELHKSRRHVIDFAIAVELHKTALNESEMQVLKKLQNFYDKRLGIVLKNTKPLVTKPIKVHKRTIYEYAWTILTYLSKL